jgi:hypothetical protein
LEEAMGIEKISVGKTPQIAIGKAKGSFRFRRVAREKVESPTTSPQFERVVGRLGGVQILAEDLAEARRETWGGFPRQDV